MVVRENFEQSLKVLQEKIMEMTELTVSMLEKSFYAMKTQDIEASLRVMEDDNEIDELEEEINHLAIWLVVKESPVARDLRMIIGIIKISSEIERIADFGVNFAKSTIIMGNEDELMDVSKLEQMKEICITMLRKSLVSFFDGDLALAKQVGDMDDEIDDLSDQTYKEFTKYLSENPEKTNQIVQLLLINRYLERIGDHITNIGESAAYLIKGRMYDLNQ
ncbi:phosphate signaling complex protein PhoU [Bacillus kwashiorkori]|uniref:phosphate signaling complex protein PhoU n=1 Tax=Bacillus kwashiorkori TaxID=1522318 RepID=UPI0008F89C38|nr:phosphate signaling complex protein PhoU [Bacillus kwashiorkori]